MQDEKEDTYIWALQQLWTIFTSHNRPFPSCFSTDREMALLNALALVFPDSHHLLCIWHINKNFITQLKKSSLRDKHQEEVTKMWNHLVQETTKHEYEVFLLALQDFLFDHEPTFMDYLSMTWLGFKEKFVAHWANQILHFGNIATS